MADFLSQWLGLSTDPLGTITEGLGIKIPFLSDLTEISDAFADLSSALIGLVVPQESVIKSVTYWSRVPILTYGLFAAVGAGAAYAFVNSPELQQQLYQYIMKRKLKGNQKVTYRLE